MARRRIQQLNDFEENRETVPFLWLDELTQASSEDFPGTRALQAPELIDGIEDRNIQLLFRFSLFGPDGAWESLEAAGRAEGFAPQQRPWSASTFATAPDRLGTLVLLEIWFWWLFMQSRRGLNSRVTPELQELLHIAESQGWSHFHPRAETLHGLVLVSRGYFSDGSRVLERAFAALPESELFWRFRTLIPLGTAWQAMGLFEKSESCLLQTENISKRIPLPSLRWTLLRRRLSLLVESERCEQAQVLVRTFLPEVRRHCTPATQALFLQECVRLASFLEDAQSFQNHLEELNAVVAAAQLPPTFLSLVEERCEWDLRTHKPQVALERIRETLWETQMRDEVAGQVAALSLCARILAQQGKEQEGYGLLKQAWSLCHENHFGRDAVKALLGMAAYELRHGLVDRAHESLQRAAQLECLGMLPVENFCFSALMAVARGASLVAAFERPCPESGLRRIRMGTLKRLAPWLDETLVFQAGDGSDASITLLSTDDAFGLFWNPRLSRAYVFRGALESTFTLDPNELLGRCLRFVFSHERQGFALEDLHRLLSPRITFVRHRHEPRLRSLLKRCQDKLRPLGLEVSYQRTSGRYLLTGTTPFFVCRTQGIESEKQTLRPKEREVLEYLRGKADVASGELQRSFGVTRQTLHPILTRLLMLGYIGRRKRARATEYYAKS